MRLLHSVDSGYFGTRETPYDQKHFQQLIEWLCQCISQDPVSVLAGAKMLILWSSIRIAPHGMAHGLRTGISGEFLRMKIEVRQLPKHLGMAWINKDPYAIFKDNELIDKLREDNIRYLIGIF